MDKEHAEKAMMCGKINELQSTTEWQKGEISGLESENEKLDGKLKECGTTTGGA